MRDVALFNSNLLAGIPEIIVFSKQCEEVRSCQCAVEIVRGEAEELNDDLTL